MLPTRPIRWFMFAFHLRLLIGRYLGMAEGDSDEFESDWKLAAGREFLLAEEALDAYRIFAVPLLGNDIDSTFEERTKQAFLGAGIPHEKIEGFYNSFYCALWSDPTDDEVECSSPDGAFAWIN